MNDSNPPARTPRTKPQSSVQAAREARQHLKTITELAARTGNASASAHIMAESAKNHADNARSYAVTTKYCMWATQIALAAVVIISICS